MSTQSQKEEPMEVEKDGPATPRRKFSTKTSSKSPSVQHGGSACTTQSLSTVPRSRARAHSLLRSTLRKMRGRYKCAPGGASAKSLTDLICSEYGWPVCAVLERVEKALERAVKEGRAQVIGKGRLRKYAIAPGKMKDCIEKNHHNNSSSQGERIRKTFHNRLGPSVKCRGNHRSTNQRT